MSESNISTKKNFDLACKLLLSMQEIYFKISKSKYLNMTLSQLIVQYWNKLHLSKHIRNERGGSLLGNNNVYTEYDVLRKKNKSSVQFQRFLFYPNYDVNGGAAAEMRPCLYPGLSVFELYIKRDLKHPTFYHNMVINFIFVSLFIYFVYFNYPVMEEQHQEIQHELWLVHVYIIGLIKH